MAGNSFEGISSSGKIALDMSAASSCTIAFSCNNTGANGVIRVNGLTCGGGGNPVTDVTGPGIHTDSWSNAILLSDRYNRPGGWMF